MTTPPTIYPTKCGDSFWRRCILMSTTTYTKFSSRSYPRRPGSLHRPLLPIHDLISTLPGKTICIPIPSLPLQMHISYHNMFPIVSYVLPKGFPKIHTDTPRNACGVWTAAGWVCCVLNRRSPTQVTVRNNHHVPRYLWYYSSIHFSIHAFNHREHANLSQAVCRQYRLNQLNPNSNPNLTLKLNLGDLFPLYRA
jgi:hypothetical protein